jgi:hypothetical protein
VRKTDLSLLHVGKLPETLIMPKSKTIKMGKLFKKIGAGVLTTEQAVVMFNRLHGNIEAMHKELLALLEPHAVRLKKAGFEVEYLAYAIPYHMNQAAEAEAAEQSLRRTLETVESILRHGQNPWSRN